MMPAYSGYDLPPKVIPTFKLVFEHSE